MMNLKSFQQLVIAATLFSTAYSVQAVVDKPSAPEKAPKVAYRYPVVTAPLLSQPPAIDGAVQREEWTGSAQMAPFLTGDQGVVADEVSTMFIGYTPDTLYVAFKFDRPPFALEPYSGTDPMKVWGDDAIELFLRPEFRSNWEYSFVGNAAGLHEEGRRAGATDRNWKANWTYKARQTSTGWEGEMAIPFASLGVASPEPGTAWEIMPWHNQKTPRRGVVGWNYMSQKNSKYDFGYLIFGGAVPAARVLQAGEISRNEIGAVLEVTNFTEKASELVIHTALYQPKAEETDYFKRVDSAANPLGEQAEVLEYVAADTVFEEVLKDYNLVQDKLEEVTVPANQTRRIAFTNEAARGKYVLFYQVREAGENGRILNSGALPFYRRAPLELQITPYILAAGAVETVANYRKVAEAREGDVVVVEWRDEAGKAILKTKKAPIDIVARQTAFDIPTNDLKPGPYTVRTVIQSPDGNMKAERQEVYTLPAKPAWWGNDIGKPEVSDMVPEPWTPMVKTAQGFDVWNREVSLGEALQPSQISNGSINNGSTSMLPRAARLDMAMAGLTWSSPQVVQTKKTGISYRQEFQGRNAKGALLLEAEFDGFMKYTLQVEPVAGVQGDANLDRLVLHIPLDPKFVTHFRHGALGTPPSSAQVSSNGNYGALPEDGISIPFTQTFWLGDDTLGFEWSAESDQWWTPKDKKQAIQVVRTSEATTLRVNFVESPRVLKSPLRYQWALLPTPTKPMNMELLHDLRLAQGGWWLDEGLTKLDPRTEEHITAMVKADVNAINQWSWTDAEKQVWNPHFSAPGYNPDIPLNEVRAKAFREANQMAYRKGIKWVIAYAIWSTFPQWPNVGELWKEQALYPLSSSFQGYLYCPAQPFNDWYIDTLKKTIEQTDINGVFLDSSPNPRACANLHHGHGYVDEDGQIHVTYPVWGGRELHKRIYTLFHGEVKKGGLLYAHNSHFPFMAVESFVDVHHTGEGSALKREWWIPKFYGRPFGVPVSFTRWNNPLYPETRMQSWGTVLQLNSTIKAAPSMVISKKDSDYRGDTLRETMFKGYDINSEVVYNVWQAQKDFPFGQAQWIPSWRIAPYAQTGDADILPAMHLVPGKQALVVVSSYKDKTQQVNLKLDWQKMGFDPAKVKLVDSITNEVLTPTAEGVTMEVLDKRWRMFSIQLAG